MKQLLVVCVFAAVAAVCFSAPSPLTEESKRGEKAYYEEQKGDGVHSVSAGELFPVTLHVIRC